MKAELESEYEQKINRGRSIFSYQLQIIFNKKMTKITNIRLFKSIITTLFSLTACVLLSG